jgi:hypothetical protein
MYRSELGTGIASYRSEDVKPTTLISWHFKQNPPTNQQKRYRRKRRGRAQVAYIPFKRRRTERNPSAMVASVGLPRSRGGKTGVRTGAMAEGDAKSEGGNPSRDPCARFMDRTTSSPALGAKVPAKHRASLHQEGSGDREDGAVQDEGANLHGRKQEKDASRTTKHMRMHQKIRDEPNNSPVQAINHALYSLRSHAVAVPVNGVRRLANRRLLHSDRTGAMIGRRRPAIHSSITQHNSPCATDGEHH